MNKIAFSTLFFTVFILNCARAENEDCFDKAVKIFLQEDALKLADNQYHAFSVTDTPVGPASALAPPFHGFMDMYYKLYHKCPPGFYSAEYGNYFRDTGGTIEDRIILSGRTKNVCTIWGFNGVSDDKNNKPDKKHPNTIDFHLEDSANYFAIARMFFIADGDFRRKVVCPYKTRNNAH